MNNVSARIIPSQISREKDTEEGMNNALERQFKLAQVRQVQKPVFPADMPKKPELAQSAQSVAINELVCAFWNVVAMVAVVGVMFMGALFLGFTVWIITHNIIVTITLGAAITVVTAVVARIFWKMIHN